MVRPKVANPKARVTSLRLSEAEKEEMERASKILGYRSVSDYLRHLHEASISKQHALLNNPAKKNYGALRVAHSTKLGNIFQGNSLQYLHHKIEASSVNLIVTSPPFGLVAKKSYGNEDAVAYLNWFRPFAAGFKRALRDDGSLVIDIGGAWRHGMTTTCACNIRDVLSIFTGIGTQRAMTNIQPLLGISTSQCEGTPTRWMSRRKSFSAS